MNKKRKKTRILALLLAMTFGWVAPPSAMAQQDRGGLFMKGIFGGRDFQEEAGALGVLDQELGSTTGGLFNQGFGGTSGGLFNQGFGGTHGGLGNQNFGGTQGGITNEGFDVPIGGGLLVLVAAGAGYASLKKRNKKQNKQNKQNQH